MSYKVLIIGLSSGVDAGSKQTHLTEAFAHSRRSPDAEFVMKTYTFYLHQGVDEIPAFEIEMFAHSDEALSHARALLAERLRYDRVVVTEETDELAHIHRPAATGQEAAA